VAKKLLNQTNLPLKRAFIKQLRASKLPLLDSFLCYLGMLETLGASYLTERTGWQDEDYQAALGNYKTIWHRTRRGGKSLGLSVLAVFFSLIEFGYRSTKGKVVWRAPFRDQLEQAQDWLKLNPFVEYIDNDNNVEILMSQPIDMSCISSGKVASKGAAVLIMDEYKKIGKDLKMYKDAVEAYGMLAEGPVDFKRMISASTGQRNTLFHDQFLSGEWCYCRHPYKDCGWISEEFIESERLSNPEDPWYIEQEYECVWVARGGSAFRNIYIVDMEGKRVIHGAEQYKFGDHPFFPLNWQFPTARKAGVDFNDSAGHYVMIGSTDDEAVYLNQEYVVSSVAELKKFGDLYSMEIESGPFEINIQNAKKCVEQKVKCIHRNWDKDVIAARFRELMDKMIVINKHNAPITLRNLEESVFDETARDSKLKKRSDQHGLDATMHMIHKTAMPVKVYRRPVIQINQSNSTNIF
jgi:hypothetical protein